MADTKYKNINNKKVQSEKVRFWLRIRYVNCEVMPYVCPQIWNIVIFHVTITFLTSVILKQIVEK
jgi:hypothetical protein